MQVINTYGKSASLGNLVGALLGKKLMENQEAQERDNLAKAFAETAGVIGGNAPQQPQEQVSGAAKVEMPKIDFGFNKAQSTDYVGNAARKGFGASANDMLKNSELGRFLGGGLGGGLASPVVANSAPTVNQLTADVAKKPVADINVGGNAVPAATQSVEVEQKPATEYVASADSVTQDIPKSLSEFSKGLQGQQPDASANKYAEFLMSPTPRQQAQAQMVANTVNTAAIQPQLISGSSVYKVAADMAQKYKIPMEKMLPHVKALADEHNTKVHNAQIDEQVKGLVEEFVSTDDVNKQGKAMFKMAALTKNHNQLPTIYGQMMPHYTANNVNLNDRVLTTYFNPKVGPASAVSTEHMVGISPAQQADIDYKNAMIALRGSGGSGGGSSGISSSGRTSTPKEISPKDMVATTAAYDNLWKYIGEAETKEEYVARLKNSAPALSSFERIGFNVANDVDYANTSRGVRFVPRVED